MSKTPMATSGLHTFVHVHTQRQRQKRATLVVYRELHLKTERVLYSNIIG